MGSRRFKAGIQPGGRVLKEKGPFKGSKTLNPKFKPI